MTIRSRILLAIMEEVFRALGDPGRRKLLDGLFVRDGQTLSELTSYLEMTRFGVMKHLRLLETAGLITTRRVGREKLHYLNPIPIQLIHERWISKYEARWLFALTGLKQSLEEESTVPKPTRIYQIYIQTTPEKLWQSLTDPDLTQNYYYGTRIEAQSWQAGAKHRYTYSDGTLVAQGELLEVQPPLRLKMTFQALWQPELAQEAPVQITWEIEPEGEVCKLTVVFEADSEEAQMLEQADGGMPMILSGLKTLLETGSPLRVEA